MTKQGEYDIIYIETKITQLKGRYHMKRKCIGLTIAAKEEEGIAKKEMLERVAGVDFISVNPFDSGKVVIEVWKIEK